MVNGDSTGSDSDSSIERVDDDARSRLKLLIDSLHSYQEDDLHRLDDAVIGEARVRPELVALVGQAGLSSDRALTRCAAAVFMGRAAGLGDERLAKKIEDLLLYRLRQESDEQVIFRVVIGLFHAWGRREDHDVELRLARDPDYRCRLAAAFAMAHSDVSDTPELQQALAELANDDHTVVRYWANVGIRHLTE